MSQAAIKLEHNAFGQLVLIDSDGAAHPVTPVRSFMDSNESTNSCLQMPP